MQQLIERLGKLSGPDRMTDALIAAAVKWRHPDFRVETLSKPERVEWEPHEDGSVRLWPTSERHEPYSLWRRYAPAFTGSWDAAMTLLPDGAEYSISTLYGLAEVELPLNARDRPERVQRKDGNAILAFVEACLKSRQSSRAAEKPGGERG